MKYFLAGLLAFSAGYGLAAEELSVLSEYSVVGVISTGSTNKTNIAVIKDHEKNRSMTIKEGSSIGELYTVKSILRKKIIVTDGVVDMQLSDVQPQKRNIDRTSLTLEASLNSDFGADSTSRKLEWAQDSFVATEKMKDSSTFSASWKEYIKKYKEEIEEAGLGEEFQDELEQNLDEEIDQMKASYIDEDVEYDEEETEIADEEATVDIYGY